MFYICTEIKQLIIGHNNSRQAFFAFSDKAETPLCKGSVLQIYGYFPDYQIKMFDN